MFGKNPHYNSSQEESPTSKSLLDSYQATFIKICKTHFHSPQNKQCQQISPKGNLTKYTIHLQSSQ